MNKKLCGYFILAVVVFIIDRATKMAALAYCAEDVCRINFFLSFELLFNRGISWGMLHSASDTVFLLVSLIIVTVTALLCVYTYHNYVRGASIAGETLIIAGSIFNLIDRVIYGGVIDFIVLSYGNVSWPVFNIADAAIVVGVGILVFQHEK